MTQIFHPSMNTFSKVTIFGGLLIVAALTFGWDQFNRSSYITEADVVRDQPVPFSHQHHVRGLGIDCRYCHTTVEESNFAGMPATEICMSCHSQIWKDSPMLQPVRESFRTGKPLLWTRVHDVPDFVYFNHGIHVAKGIGCESCHGRVDEMPLMRRAHSLQMSWCLECHRHPADFVRVKEDIFKFGQPGEKLSPARSEALLKEYGVDLKILTDCWTCHR
ncbi:MAG: cytochrome c3 family protein [Planctomycetes bacterium]|nr:cytochrome c3 family protein [Planctomycetota bacterium]